MSSSVIKKPLGVYDNDIQMLKITSAQYGNLKSIYMWFIMGRSLAVWRNDISSFFTRVHSNYKSGLVPKALPLMVLPMAFI